MRENYEQKLELVKAVREENRSNEARMSHRKTFFTDIQVCVRMRPLLQMKERARQERIRLKKIHSRTKANDLYKVSSFAV